MNPEVYTIPELAARWKCSKDILYDLLTSKRLKGFKVGGVWRISTATVERYERGEA